MIKKFNQFIKEEASPRIPNSPDYWVNKKGKEGKNVMIYTHDDLDGIFSAIAIKKYLLSKGFKIVGYGIVNYQEGWNVIDIKTDVINVAVDFAEYHPDIDVYIDHHGDFLEGEDIKKQGAIKTKTGSAYEGIMDVLGLPVDSTVLDVIDMVDSAKYDEYGVKWMDLMEFEPADIVKKPNAKLLFAGAFNQLIKRGDFQTIIEVIHNATEPSIYQIFNLFKIFSPLNNQDKFGRPMDFVSSAKWRMSQVKSRTGGSAEFKDVIKSQSEFINKYTVPLKDENGNIINVVKLDGYVIIGEIAFVGSGTWANAIRARAIIQRDIQSGRLPEEAKKIKWILLQYGDTLQIASVGKIDEYDKDDLPKTKDGKPIDNLKKYCEDLLKKMDDNLNFKNQYTLAGGHTGIGTISNIGSKKYINNFSKFGFEGLKYLDIFKNYIISNLSKVPWKLDLCWENPLSPEKPNTEAVPLDARVMYINQIRTTDIKKNKNVVKPDDYEPKESMAEMKKKAADLRALEAELEEQKKRDGIERAKAKHNEYRFKKSEEQELKDDIEKEEIKESYKNRKRK